jgi:hypothetical protein
MEKNEKKIRRYESALNLLFYEGQIAWQLNIVFIALNAGLATLTNTSLSNGICHFNGLLLSSSIIGVLINLLWFGTFQRNNKYYNFRVAQAREIEPIEWKFLSDRGYKFSKGKKIEINGKEIEPKDVKHKLNIFESLVSNKNAIKAVILLLSLVYVILIIISLHFLNIINP